MGRHIALWWIKYLRVILFRDGVGFRIKFEKIWVQQDNENQPEICSVDIRKKNSHLCGIDSAQKTKKEIRIPWKSMYSLSVFTNQEFYSINTNWLYLEYSIEYNRITRTITFSNCTWKVGFFFINLRTKYCNFNLDFNLDSAVSRFLYTNAYNVSSCPLRRRFISWIKITFYIIICANSSCQFLKTHVKNISNVSERALITTICTYLYEKVDWILEQRGSLTLGTQWKSRSLARFHYRSAWLLASKQWSFYFS